MFYPDLRSLDDVDDLPMPEFNLRVHCIVHRMKLSNPMLGFDGESKGASPEAPKRPLIEVLAEMKRKKLTEEANANANTS